MELGGGGRRGAGDRVRRQLQSVGRFAAYLGGSFLLLSAASSVAVRSLRALSDANQVRLVPHPPKREPFSFRYRRPATDSMTLSEEVRYAVRRLRGERNLRVQALQGQRHHRLVPDARPGVRQSMPLPYLRWDQVSHLLQDFLLSVAVVEAWIPVIMIWMFPVFFFSGCSVA
jgi:hypothetical protein